MRGGMPAACEACGGAVLLAGPRARPSVGGWG